MLQYYKVMSLFKNILTIWHSPLVEVMFFIGKYGKYALQFPSFLPLF